METWSIGNGHLEARASARGGCLVDAYFDGVPILRPYQGDEKAAADPLKAASFPFLPFGNRVEGNRFSFEAEDHILRANTEWDPLYLHGDAWLAEWRLVEAEDERIVLAIDRSFDLGDSAHSPYRFYGRQEISVENGSLVLALEVTNAGDTTLPFGLGHHCFFPLTRMTTLKANATDYWTEKAGFLPAAREPLPIELDFSAARRIPRRWLNNGFEGWEGTADIAWPERGLTVSIEAQPVFSRYFLFHSDPAFEPGFADDYFCFEPMTHSANGHNLADLGGLRPLKPGETQRASLTITPTVLR
ncbi:aldose 1-epimerase [Pararhizobium mangrovi]|uniref:Aldose 1-epimerase n=1 Tax=Pararhizobium mangrovi TaxID=2590452 RepID=A0A506UCB6_9HYPH|nr:aldose 1-epimerase [Pararhizobium mangrovi]TPW30465.1 aldose 1-epimerase [Pararhizobium mangrovi]